MISEVIASLPPIEDLGENDEIGEPVTALGDVSETGAASGAPTEGDPQGAEALGTEGTAQTPAGEEGAASNAPTEGDKPADAEIAALREKAELFEAIQNSYGQNQVAFVQGLLKTMSAEQLQALGLAGQTADPKAAAADEAGWQDAELTAPERLVKSHREHIAQLPVFRQQVEQMASQHSQYLQGLAFQNALLEAQVSALLEASDLALPQVDAQAVLRLVQTGKTYSEAIREVASPLYKTAISSKKAAATATPKTPLGGTRAPAPVEPKAGSSFLEYARFAKQKLAAAGQ